MAAGVLLPKMRLKTCHSLFIFGLLFLDWSTPAVGQAGHAFFLDGVDDYIEIVVPEALLYGEWTVEFWLYPSSGSGLLDPVNHDCFIQTRDFDATQDTPRILWKNDDPAVQAFPDGFLPTDPANAEPIHLALVYNQSEFRQRRYRNGEQLHVLGAMRPQAGAHRQNWQSRILVGGCYVLTPINELQRTRLLQGYIDEVRFWNRALTIEEIRGNMYNASESLCCPLLRADADNLATATEWIAAVDPGTGETTILSPGSGVAAVPAILPSPFTNLEGGPLVATLSVGLVGSIDLRLEASHPWLRVNELPGNISIIDTISDTLLASSAGQVVQATEAMGLLADILIVSEDVLLVACQTFDDCNQSDPVDRALSTFERRVVVTAKSNVPPVAGALYEIELFASGLEGGFIEIPKATSNGTLEFWLRQTERNRGSIWGMHDDQGVRKIFLFMQGNIQQGTFVHHGWRGGVSQQFYFPMLYNADIQHLAFVWEELGKREDIWCWEWEPEVNCTNESTPLGVDVWEYTFHIYLHGEPLPIAMLIRYPGAEPNKMLLNYRITSLSRMTLGFLNGPRSLKSGRYSEVRYWSSSKSHEEIKNNYQRQMTGTESDLLAYIGPSPEDFGAVPAEVTTAYTAYDLAEEARYAAEVANLDHEQECSMSPPRPSGQSELLCEAEDCGFEYRRGFIVRRTRFPNIQARPLLWEVSEGGTAAILPIPRHDPDDIEDGAVTERPDLLPADTPLQELRTAWVASAGALANVSVASGEPTSCGDFSLNGSVVSLADSLSLVEGEQLYFEPAPLLGTESCDFSLTYTVMDRSGASGFAPGQVDVRVLPLAPELLSVQALDNKPGNRVGVQAEDELHFVFDKPTNKPRVTSIAELLNLFDVSPVEAVPTDGFFIACWTGDGRRLILSILDPAEPWSSILTASFAVHQGQLRGRADAPTAWSQISMTSVAVVHEFDTRPCAGEGEFLDPVSNQCAECEVGRRLADNGQGCVACSAGSFLDEPGGLDCKPCLSGEYQPLEGQSSCLECPHGRASETPGVANCSLCERGSFSDVTGSSACLECPVGSYAQDEGVTECLPCFELAAEQEEHPEAWVTMERLLAGQGLVWVYLSGATNASQCGCDTGYVEFESHCHRCTEGTVCAGMGEIYVEEGYFVAANSISVFECRGRTQQCAGGLPGSTCAEGRTHRACVDCIFGKSPAAGGRCEECSEGGYGTLVVALAAGLCALVLLYRVVSSEKRALQGHAFLMASICFSHMCTLAQQLSVVSLLSTNFGEPFNSLQEFLKIFIFDFAVLGVDCVSTTTASSRYILSLFAIAMLLTIVVIIHHVYVAVFHKCRYKKRLPALVSAIGTLMLAFYVSVVSTVVQPFQCFEHPSGDLTPRAFQSVICYTAGDHVTMMVASCIGFIFPLSFYVGCLWAVLRTGEAVRCGHTRFISAFGFLLNRFKPSAHFFPLWLLFRAFTMALAPLIPRVDLQVLAITILLICSLLLTAQLRPWRAPLGNEVDLAITAGVQLVVLIGAILVDDDDVSLEALSAVALALTLSAFVLALAAITGALLRLVWPGRKEYQFFLSHHKIGSGATARMLKLSLTQAGSRKVFYDSDDLMNLDSLCNLVSHHVETLVLVGSKEVLTRPWCLGELTVGRIKHLPAVCVAWPDFSLPVTDDLAANGVAIAELDCLHEYEISLDDVRDTFTWVQTLKVVEIDACSAEAFSSVAGALVGGGRESSPRNANRPSVNIATQNPSAVVVITADSLNREASVTAFILQKYMKKAAELRVEMMPNISLDAAKADEIHREATTGRVKHLIVLCSTKAFYSPCVARNLVSCFRRGLSLTPAVIDNAFAFPSALDFEALKSQAAEILGDNDEAAGDDLAQAAKVLFKEIAIPFIYTASDFDLAARSKQIVNRLGASAPRRVTQGSGTGIGNSQHSAGAAALDSDEEKVTPEPPPPPLEKFQDENFEVSF